MSEPPRIEVTIAAPVHEVWAALRDREQIRNWHGWEYEGIDKEIDLIYFQPLAEDERAHTLSVQNGDVFQLEPDGEGTRVRLTRAARGDDPYWDAYYEEMTEGWIVFVHQLRFFMERQRGVRRRTLFFSGGAGAGSVAGELGIGGLAGRPDGTAFTAELVGEQVKGEVWCTATHQLGVTLDAWGNGLLIVAHVRPTEAKPAGAAMAVLSTYGLDDAALNELRGRWQQWWDQRYPALTP
jgi:hypothetical protein